MGSPPHDACGVQNFLKANDMATRSVIALKTPDGRLRAVYCHYDGYLDGVGAVLCQHYQNQDLITALLDLGDLSSLETILDTSEFYRRDRQEHDCDSQWFHTLQEIIDYYDDCEYFYVWDQGAWMYSQGKSWKNLREQLDIMIAQDAE